jgi:hypothetical protein
MDYDANAFIQAVLHVVLIIMIHGRRAGHGFQAHRKQTTRREVVNRRPPNAFSRPVAQKQSPRLISERTRSVTARDDHPE